MNARFAEPCRASALALEISEGELERNSIRDDRKDVQLKTACEKDIYIGVFFDGTNNNKYRNTPGFSHSNVARLYEVFPGTPAAQKEPTLKSRVNPDGSTTPRRVFSDEPFKPSSIPAENFSYYRKIYVPGLGTPMPDVGDSGEGKQRTGGLVGALLGQIRLDWATLQLVNQVHAAIFKRPIEVSVDMTGLVQVNGMQAMVIPAIAALSPAVVAVAAMDELASSINRLTGSYDPSKFNSLLDGYLQQLVVAMKRYGNNKPTMRKIRLSVFGFSRGAAEARAWVNMVTNRFGGNLADIPLQIDFLGVFDTVASVGLAQSTPNFLTKSKATFEGHAGWAEDQYMPVPASLKRCVHLVAALEVRGSFPLDSVCQGGMLPPNCKEIAYPGVHSDVGGGYPPDDQGRALGQGAAGDKFKLSQISLAQMYREARMAGVPLAPESAMIGYQKTNFAIDPQLREAFNAYIAATRSGTVPPTQGQGEPTFARMFPTETQPREELFRLMRRHYGILLRWRKATMNRPGGMAGLPNLKQAASTSRFQDIEDFRGAEEELRKEILFLQSADPEKFTRTDDPLLEKASNGLAVTGNVAGSASIIPGATIPGLLVVYLSLRGRESIVDVMHEKQRQWDSWLQYEWADHSSNALPDAADKLFSLYLHDSRAWFKPLLQSGGLGMAPNDEDWFVFGEREKARSERIKVQNEAVARAQKSGDAKALASARQSLNELNQEGQPLIKGGREPYRMWGYVRHRRIYEAGKLVDEKFNSRQHAIDAEERQRVLSQRRQDQIAQENARHAAALKQLQERNDQVLRENKLSLSDQTEFTQGTRFQIEAEDRKHAEILLRINQETAVASS